jgi:hypothetical protein
MRLILDRKPTIPEAVSDGLTWMETPSVASEIGFRARLFDFARRGRPSLSISRLIPNKTPRKLEVLTSVF